MYVKAKRCFSILIALAAVFTSLACPIAHAAKREWPAKNLNMIVPFKAGGSLDASARLLAQYWEKELGVKVTVDNRGGASGQVGTTYFMGLPDDGYNIIMGAQIFYSSNIIYQQAAYSIDDIAVLNYLEIDPGCLSVTPDSPY